MWIALALAPARPSSRGTVAGRSQTPHPSMTTHAGKQSSLVARTRDTFSARW